MGILIYEMLCGFTPFEDIPLCREDIVMKNILQADLQFPKSQFSSDAISLLKDFLNVDPAMRLGCRHNEIMDIRHHVYFHEYDWVKVTVREAAPPWRPVLKSPIDATNFR